MQAKTLSNLALIYCWPQPISLCLSKENLTQGFWYVRKFKSASVLGHFILTTTLGSVGFITPFYVNLTKVIMNKRWSVDSDPGICLNPYPLHFPQPPALPLMSRRKKWGKIVKPRAPLLIEKSPLASLGSVSEQLTLRSQDQWEIQHGQLFVIHILQFVYMGGYVCTYRCSRATHTVVFKWNPYKCAV